MNKTVNFVGLASKVSEIHPENSDLVQVQNLSSKMQQVSKGKYLLERGFALIDASDPLAKKLIDENILLIIDTPIRDRSKNEQPPVPKRKSKIKISNEQKAKVDELGQLFKND
jgi:hypothetical protein